LLTSELHNQFTSMSYLLRVFGTLAGLLLAFYGIAKWLIPRWMHLQGMPSSRKQVGLLQPKVLFKTALAPGRDLHVIEVQNKILLVGSTPQHISLLTQLDDGSKPEVTTTPTETVYQKYLD